jgi:SAM-dependent methyltransferase
MTAFNKFSHYDTLLHSKSITCFSELLKEIDSIIFNSEDVVEVGFGRGDQLVRFLRGGANIFGIDLSAEAVNNFKATYPEYSSRVSCSTRFDFDVHTVYANALFEHLDNPDDFLSDISTMLQPGGQLILRLPVITAFSEQSVTDINFWKPCHRVLYTIRGLTTLLERNGFALGVTAALDYYGYRVMNCMLRNGFSDIGYLRNPFYAIKGLESDLRYKIILLKALWTGSICSDFALIAKKQYNKSEN